MSDALLEEIQKRYEAPHDPCACGKNCEILAHRDVPALLAHVRELRQRLERVREARATWVKDAAHASAECDRAGRDRRIGGWFAENARASTLKDCGKDIDAALNTPPSGS